MMRLTRYINKKFIIPIIVGLCGILLVAYVTWTVIRQRLPPQEELVEDHGHDASDTKPAISLQDIKQLPDKASYDDVANLLKAYIIADNLMYICPAKEGGIYFFSFFQTREVSLPESKDMEDKLWLVAVIKSPSEDALFKEEFGEYVFPAKLAGVTFSGFLLGTGVQNNTKKGTSNGVKRLPK